MKNCLSDNKFENLLFVDVRIHGISATALFDTGAGMTVIVRSLLEQLGIAAENEIQAGNNGGVVRAFRTAVVSDVRFGDVRVDELEVIVMDDENFTLTDESGNAFPANMLLGWDVISQYRWDYSAKDKTLAVSLPDTEPDSSNRDIRQESVVFPEYSGLRFKAGVDTGHTESMLGAVWLNRLPDVEHHETEIVGIGSARRESVPYVKSLEISYQGHVIHLQNTDICEELYGQPEDTEALLGIDFLKDTDWRLDKEFWLL